MTDLAISFVTAREYVEVWAHANNPDRLRGVAMYGEGGRRGLIVKYVR